MQRQAISIKDLAKLAGVSHSTVSRALQNSTLVNPVTAAKIRELASREGYRPSLIARSLVRRETCTIGCVVTSFVDPFFAEVFQGIEETAQQHGYSVILAQSSAEPDREMATVLSFQDRRVDGVLVAASRVGSRYASVLASMQIPIVLINSQQRGRYLYSIGIDNRTAARRIAQHLIDLGHRRIACIGDRLGQYSDVERNEGWQAAMTAARLSMPREWALQGDGNAEGGAAAMREMLSGRERPTAVLCYNDLTALGALSSAHDAGLSVPDDLSITGFDDLFLASYTNPALTTIRQPMRQMGVRAMEILLDLFGGKGASRVVKMQGDLIIRGSTAAPRRDR